MDDDEREETCDWLTAESVEEVNQVVPGRDTGRGSLLTLISVTEGGGDIVLFVGSI